MKGEKRLFLYLTGAYFFALIALVLSHELGHYFASLIFGYNPKVSYISTDFGFPKSAFNVGSVSYTVPIEHQVWILAAGPLITIGIGIIGVILLFVFRKPFHRSEVLNAREWTMTILASFLLRQSINFTMWMFNLRLFNKFSFKSDEIKIAGLLGWQPWIIFIFSAVIAAIIFLIVILKFIPPKQRSTLFLAILAGGIIADLFWIQWLGPIILP